MSMYVICDVMQRLHVCVCVGARAQARARVCVCVLLQVLAAGDNGQRSGNVG